MKIVVLSKEGDTAALTQRFQEEGHETWLWLRKPQALEQFDGLVEKVMDDSELGEIQPDLIVSLETGSSNLITRLKQSGYLTLGNDSFQKHLESDRFASISLCESCGVKVPYSRVFHLPKPARNYLLRHQDTRFITKLDIGDEFTSYLGRHNRDTANFIRVTQELGDLAGDIVLQEYIDGPIEVNVEGWFSKGKPIEGSWNATLEQKRLMSGDMGPNTGCQSSLVWPLAGPVLWTEELMGRLEEEQYTGPLDMAFKYDGEDFYFLEFTPRLGINAGFGLIHLLENDLGQLYYDMAKGNPTAFQPRKEFAFLHTVSVPPFPYHIRDIILPGTEVELEPRNGVIYWLGDVKKVEDKLVLAGYSGWVLNTSYTSAYGYDAQKGSLEAAESVGLSEKQYRTDAGAQMNHIEDLRPHGFFDLVDPFPLAEEVMA